LEGIIPLGSNRAAHERGKDMKLTTMLATTNGEYGMLFIYQIHYDINMPMFLVVNASSDSDGHYHEIDVPCCPLATKTCMKDVQDKLLELFNNTEIWEKMVEQDVNIPYEYSILVEKILQEGFTE